MTITVPFLLLFFVPASMPSPGDDSDSGYFPLDNRVDGHYNIFNDAIACIYERRD